jgi:hypothetical protein
MQTLVLAAVIVTALAIIGRRIWPTHLATRLPELPEIPQYPDRSTGRWLRECELILAAGTGRHRAPSRLAGWLR